MKGFREQNHMSNSSHYDQTDHNKYADQSLLDTDTQQVIERVADDIYLDNINGNSGESDFRCFFGK